MLRFIRRGFGWPWSDHPFQTACAILLALVNLFYVAAVAWAFLHGRIPWLWMLGAYLVLRFLLLGTMENPEPRYTLQCFPIFIVAAAAVFGRNLPAPEPAMRQSTSG